MEKSKQSDKLRFVLDILDGSKRPMPAKFCDECFDVDYPISESDSRELAAEAWGAAPGLGTTDDHSMAVYLGEEVILGSYILAREGGEQLADELVKRVTHLDPRVARECGDYLEDCKSYGLKVAHE